MILLSPRRTLHAWIRGQLSNNPEDALRSVSHTVPTRVRALRAKTRIFRYFFEYLAASAAKYCKGRVGDALNLLASRLALASGGKTLDFRDPKS